MSYSMEQAAPPPRLNPQLAKIVEVILFLVDEGARRGLTLTQYDIVKSVFLADKRHLDEYGRPVTFDNYSAMLHGPVPSATYDMLKPNYEWAYLGMETAPWVRTQRHGTPAAEFRPTRSANLKKLSLSDVEALGSALSLAKSLTFGGLREYTHKNRAYEAAWRDSDTVKAFDMDYRLIPDFDDPELIEDLAYASRHMH